eukprot:sb/3464391/
MIPIVEVVVCQELGGNGRGRRGKLSENPRASICSILNPETPEKSILGLINVAAARLINISRIASSLNDIVILRFLSPSISDFGAGPSWELIVFLILAWVVTYLCVFQGVKSTGKAAYFAATFPYICLFILLIKGLTLPGADQGLKKLFTPDFGALLKPTVWIKAATQIFFSLSLGFGALVAFASFMPYKNNITRDTLIVAVINSFTSLFNNYPVTMPLLVVSITEAIAIGWIFGIENFDAAIRDMTGAPCPTYFKICIKYVSPVLMIFLLIWTLVDAIMHPQTYDVFVNCNPRVEARSRKEDLVGRGSCLQTRDDNFTRYDKLVLTPNHNPISDPSVTVECRVRVVLKATFPYICLFILLIKGLTLPGADQGLKKLFTPDFGALLKPTVWIKAATQIFFSLSLGFGALVAFASFMPYKNNITRDTLIVAVINSFTSAMAKLWGVVVGLLSFISNRLAVIWIQTSFSAARK